jgi:hypothetical protein
MITRDITRVGPDLDVIYVLSILPNPVPLPRPVEPLPVSAPPTVELPSHMAVEIPCETEPSLPPSETATAALPQLEVKNDIFPL